MGREGLSTFQTPSPHPLLTHCQSLTKASRKVTKGRREGQEEDRKTEAEKQEPSSTGPAQKDFPYHWNCHPSTHGKVSTYGGHTTQERTWHPTLSDKKNVLNFLIF